MSAQLADPIHLPTDPAERRRLWREWIEHDLPAPAMRMTPAARRADGPASDWLHEALPHDASMLSGLRSAIGECVIGGQIALGDRQRLTRRAMRLGLSRFEASLLIAAVLHRDSGPALRRTTVVQRPRWSVARLAMAAVALEAIAVGGAVAWLR